MNIDLHVTERMSEKEINKKIAIALETFQENINTENGVTAQLSMAVNHSLGVSLVAMFLFNEAANKVASKDSNLGEHGEKLDKALVKEYISSILIPDLIDEVSDKVNLFIGMIGTDKTDFRELKT